VSNQTTQPRPPHPPTPQPQISCKGRSPSSPAPGGPRGGTAWKGDERNHRHPQPNLHPHRHLEGRQGQQPRRVRGQADGRLHRARRVPEFDGALEVGEDLADARAYGRVDAASVDTNQARRDKHLRSTDFLSAESHPELTFRSKAFEPVDEDTFRVIGDLSINGVTNEVELTAKLGGIEAGPEGEERLGLEVTGQVSRKAFAMKFAAALGSAVIADEVKIVIDVAAVKEGLAPKGGRNGFDPVRD
jgi:polyisoprenoid-binding protein YceI